MAQAHLDEKAEFKGIDSTAKETNTTFTQDAASSNHDVSDPEKAGSLSSGHEEPVKALPPTHPSQFPEGGLQAWLCVAGGAAGLFCSFGWINCIGIFQDYYLRGPLSNYSASAIGWIPSCEVFFMLAGGPFVGWWFDNYGSRELLIVGTFLHVFGLMMVSISKEYYQFFLAQGVCSAIGASMLFTPSMTCTATWFFRRRGLAIGIVAAGSSLGGVIFPVVVSRLIPRIGFGWAMRVCAFMILGLMVFANFTITSRLPPNKRKFDIMAFVRPLKETPFLLTVIAIFLFYYGMFTPFSYIVADANAQGMSLMLSQYLVAILNAGSIFGRTLPGFIGDKLGRFNTMIAFCLLTGILILALWIPASSNAAFIVFAPLFGFASGASIALMPAMIAQISDVREIGIRTGTAFGIGSIAALTGTPIGGAIIGDGSHSGFQAMKIFCGVMTLAGTVGFLIARINLQGLKWVKV